MGLDVILCGQKSAVKPQCHESEAQWNLLCQQVTREVSLVVIIRQNKQERETHCAKVKDVESKDGGASNVF